MQYKLQLHLADTALEEACVLYVVLLSCKTNPSAAIENPPGTPDLAQARGYRFKKGRSNDPSEEEENKQPPMPRDWGPFECAVQSPRYCGLIRQ